jgi:putative drug exporter of the RND superfamily
MSSPARSAAPGRPRPAPAPPQPSRFSTAGLARASARHPWRTLGVWLVVLVLALVSASGLGKALTSSTNFTRTPESQVGANLLEQRLRGPRPVTETVLVTSQTATVNDPAFKAVVEETATGLVAMHGVVKSAPTYYQAQAAGSPHAAAMVSADRHTAIIPVTFVGKFDDANKHVDAYLRTIQAQGTAGIRVLTVGDLSVNQAFNQISSTDLAKAEEYSLPLTVLVLIVVFGALVAVGVPLLLALVSILVAIGLTAVVGRFTDLSFYVVNMIIMIGLAVGIDYTLFIVSRYREERRHGLEKIDAIAAAGGTANKAVVFSGGTVFLALMGMFLVPLTVFHSLGAGAVLVVVVAVAGTLTLVPALLGLLGDKIDWPRRRRYDALSAAQQTAYDHETYHRGFWGTISRVVMGRPAVFVVLAVALLGALALPYLDLKRGSAGIETLPPSDVKTAYQLLAQDFSVGILTPVEVVVDGPLANPQVKAGIANFEAAVAKDPVFGPVTVEPNKAGDLALLATPLKVDGNSAQAIDAVWHLRNTVIPRAFEGAPATVYVSGGPAFNADYFHIVDSATPYVFAFVLGLSFLLLLLAFRSLVVAAKAIAMNLLSVGAAYGLLVLVFQKGYLHALVGFQKSPEIEAWVPIFLFCVLFGLSMDYHVFLLSRIREHYDQTHRNRESVASGLQATAKIITGAALIMVIVFAGFATGQLVAFQQMGFGLAVAVLLDATVVRSVLVPAAMALLGDWNWYLPRWLGWLPDLRIEAPAVPAPGPGVTAAAAAAAAATSD